MNLNILSQTVLLIARLVEGAISKREEMGSEDLETLKFLILIFHLLLDKLCSDDTGEPYSQ